MFLSAINVVQYFICFSIKYDQLIFFILVFILLIAYINVIYLGDFFYRNYECK